MATHGRSRGTCAEKGRRIGVVAGDGSSSYPSPMMSESSPPSDPRARRGVRIAFGIAATGCLLAGVITYLFFEYRTKVYELDGPSMIPTFYANERAFVEQNPGELGPGDVVIFTAEVGDVAKRVVAVGGETVSYVGAVPHVEGRPLWGDPMPCPAPPRAAPRQDRWPELCFQAGRGDARWVVGVGAPGDRRIEEHLEPHAGVEVTLPPDHVYVLGDFYDHSNDSRNPTIGPVALEQVVGRVVRD